MDALTLLPPILALATAVLTRNVYWALGLAILASETLTLSGNLFLGTLAGIDRAVGVFESTGNTRILLFCLIIGALVAYMQHSGGVAAFVMRLRQIGLTATRRRAGLITMLTGVIIFVETNISLLTTGLLGRPVFDNLKISRERLAYIIDSTSAPVSVLVLLNGWGAFVLGLMAANGVEKPLDVLVATVPLNVYAWLTLLGVLLTVVLDRTFGAMRVADLGIETAQLSDEAENEDVPTRAIYAALPILVLVGGALGFMWWTGEGNLLRGDGSQSILWSVCLATAVAFLMLVAARREPGERLTIGFKGMGDLVPAVTVIFLSLVLGNSLRALGTGEYVASLAESISIPWILPALLFVAAGFTSFTTGTSWGTFGILIPIAIPLAVGAGVPLPLAVAAVMGGGVFGDHCSPISDTTIIASFAAGCDHLDHVRTQLPYALLAGGGATAIYLFAGAFSLNHSVHK